MNRLQGKVAIVTGGARGQGAATCRRFVEEGARVVIADVLEDPGSALAAELGAAARFEKHDITSEESWQKLVAATQGAFGDIDVLVNNAGILLFRTIADTSKEDFEKVVRVNLLGTFLGTRIVGAHMVARRRGSIVNISSADAMQGGNGLAAYSSSKWGVRGLTHVAALEFGPSGVRVNSVHPGACDTPMINEQRAPRSEVNKRFAMLPLQRVGTPEEMAAVTLFLASDESSYVCGSEFVVDGGLVAGHYYVGRPGAPGA